MMYVIQDEIGLSNAFVILTYNIEQPRGSLPFIHAIRKKRLGHTYAPRP